MSFFLFIIFSCSTLFRDYTLYPKINDLNRLLKKIHDLEVSKDYNGLKYYIYNVNYKKNNIYFSSQEMIINKIKKLDEDSFFYSRRGIFYHAQYVNDKNFTKSGDDKLIERYLIRPDIIKSNKRLQDLYKKDKSNFLIYENEISSIVFVKDNDEYKVLFIHNLGILSSTPRLDYSKIRW